MDFPGTVEEAARLAAGNWQEFDSFSWHRGFDLEDADQRFIYYTEHRDSGLLDQSNSEQIRQTLEPFTNGDDPDVVEESHRHWAVGYIEGYSIRVYRDGQITEAFRTLYNLMQSLSEYPVLDDEDYSRREYDVAIENIESVANSLDEDYDLPKDWQTDVFSWLWENDQRELENIDDQGAYPSEDAVRCAMDSLFQRSDAVDYV